MALAADGSIIFRNRRSTGSGASTRPAPSPPSPGRARPAFPAMAARHQGHAQLNRGVGVDGAGCVDRRFAEPADPQGRRRRHHHHAAGSGKTCYTTPNNSLRRRRAGPGRRIRHSPERSNSTRPATSTWLTPSTPDPAHRRLRRRRPPPHTRRPVGVSRAGSSADRWRSGWGLRGPQ